MIIISGILRVSAEDREKVFNLVAPLISASLAEGGCNEYGFWEDPAQPGSIRIFEEWASQEALDSHFATAHMAEFMSQMGSLKIEAMDLFRYESEIKKPLFG
ncbi:MAG TPA: putative quinol monooxygenase [Acidimicrobiales bacterium]|nr:putative quinol monooxygenase [Acidimicrobiales bacterium]